MKNFGSFLTFLAISASVVSGRALPGSENGLEARVPYPVDSEFYARSPKKGKKGAAAATGVAGAEAAATTGKAAKKAKGKAAGAGAAAGAVSYKAVL